MSDFVLVLLASIAGIAGAVTLLCYALRGIHRYKNLPLYNLPGAGSTISPGRAVVAILAEWAALATLIISYPLRLIHDLSPAPRRDPDHTPVVLIHGYGLNSACFLWMQWRLRRRGWRRVHAISYTPPTVDMRRLARQVARHIERIREATGSEQVHVVGHSMGGPLIRLALLNGDLAGQLDRVVTLGSPHAGSWLANLFRVPGAARQIRYPGPFMAELNKHDPTPGGARFWSVYSAFDNFVLPPTSAQLGGNAKNLHVPALGHCSLLFSPRVIERVDQALRGALD